MSRAGGGQVGEQEGTAPGEEEESSTALSSQACSQAFEGDVGILREEA